MHKSKFIFLSLAATAISLISVPAMAVVVTTLQSPITPGAWSSAVGTPEIVDLTGAGGNLENNAPAGKGAVKLDTTGGVAKSEVAFTSPRFFDDNNAGAASLGTIGDLVNNPGATLSYDYYQTSGAPNPNIAPAFKFLVKDLTDVQGDGYATFIFEPFYLTNSEPPKDTWTTQVLSLTDGFFWNTGIYGQSGIVYDKTLTDWIALFDGLFGPTFLDADILAISFGIGSGTDDQVGYFDNVQFNNGNFSLAYDFEVAAVPLPAAFPLYASGLALMGLAGWRRRQKKAALNA